MKRPGFETLRTLISSEGQLALSKLSKIQLNKLRHRTAVGVLTKRCCEQGILRRLIMISKKPAMHFLNGGVIMVRPKRGRWFFDKVRRMDPFYGIADMAIAEMSFELGNPNFWQNVDGILELIHALRVFVDSLFWAFIKDRKLHDFIRVDKEINKGNQ